MPFHADYLLCFTVITVQPKTAAIGRFFFLEEGRCDTVLKISQRSVYGNIKINTVVPVACVSLALFFYPLS
jgi:hypothetical protein